MKEEYLSIDTITRLVELEKENKELHDRYERCKKQKIKVENACSNYKYKIDKAIEYNQKIYDTSIENERLMAKINLDILKGENNE